MFRPHPLIAYGSYSFYHLGNLRIDFHPIFKESHQEKQAFFAMGVAILYFGDKGYSLSLFDSMAQLDVSEERFSSFRSLLFWALGLFAICSITGSIPLFVSIIAYHLSLLNNPKSTTFVKSAYPFIIIILVLGYLTTLALFLFILFKSR